MGNVNMADVARAAGVSVATVGRVLHNNGYVSPEARQRVEEKIAALGYVPNQMARTLKSRKSGIIGSLVTYNPNALYHKINGSVLEAATKEGFELLTIEGLPGRGDEERLINRFIGMQVDGLVITSNAYVPNTLFERLRQQSIPVVAVERGYKSPYVDNLLVDDFNGAYGVIAKMARHSHHRVALIAMAPLGEVEQERLRGYRAAVKDLALADEDALIQLVPTYSMEDGYGAMQALLALPNPPTAVFATADTLAAGAMQCLYKKGVRVPQGMSIAGYDNVLASALAPQIDSVDLMVENIGGNVLSMLLRRMENPALPPQTQRIGTVYVARGTVQSL